MAGQRRSLTPSIIRFHHKVESPWLGANSGIRVGCHRHSPITEGATGTTTDTRDGRSLRPAREGPIAPIRVPETTDLRKEPPMMEVILGLALTLPAQAPAPAADPRA